MKSIEQKDKFGCAIACVAFVLNRSYSEAVELFKDGERRAREEKNFYCPEITRILNSNGLHYSWEKFDGVNLNYINRNLSIAFLKKSQTYPFGHFLVRYKNKWMDPWLNLPEKPVKSGFRKELPGNPSYLIFKS